MTDFTGLTSCSSTARHSKNTIQWASRTGGVGESESTLKILYREYRRAPANILEDILGYFALLQHHSDKK
jgi:hypothetical protein